MDVKFKAETYDFNSDIDLESAWLRYGFCTLSHYSEHLTKVNRNCFRGKGDIERTRNGRLKLVTFNFDLGFESD